MKRDEEVNSDDGDDDMMVLTLPRLLLPVIGIQLLSVWHACCMPYTAMVCCCVSAFRMLYV